MGSRDKAKEAPGRNQGQLDDVDVDKPMKSARTSAISGIIDIWAEEEEDQVEQPDFEKQNFIDAVKIDLAGLRQIRTVLKRDDVIFNWWAIKSETFPKLYDVARIIFGIPATSVSSERVFSGAGQIYGNIRQRNRLGGQKAEHLLLKSGLHKLKLSPIYEETDDEEENDQFLNLNFPILSVSV